MLSYSQMIKYDPTKSLGKYAIKGNSGAFLGKKHSKESKKKMSLARLGKKFPNLRKEHPSIQNEKHFNWKGDKVSYRNLHRWVERNSGKASYCSFDPTHISKRYDWANISGSYLRDVDDFISLCRKCHKQYDMIRKGSVYL